MTDFSEFNLKTVCWVWENHSPLFGRHAVHCSLLQVLVLLDVTPDQAMVDEGVAREVINRIQKLRKKVSCHIKNKLVWVFCCCCLVFWLLGRTGKAGNINHCNWVMIISHSFMVCSVVLVGKVGPSTPDSFTLSWTWLLCFSEQELSAKLCPLSTFFSSPWFPQDHLDG